MYSSRRHLYGSRHYFLWSFFFAFLRRGALHRCEIPTGNSKVRRWSGVLLPVLFLVGLMSLPLSLPLVRDYQWERSRPPTTVVPDLIGLPLMTGRERAHSVHLMTKVLGSTWYTNLSPGRLTLQSPEAGQRVPFETTIGVELAIMPPDWMPPESVSQERDPVARQGFASKSRLRGTR